MSALVVGVPREIKSQEKRVALTPDGVGRLTREGVSVCVQREAGTGSGFLDSDYERAGAQLIRETAELYERAGLIQKVKEPLEAEWERLSERHLVFCYLHLSSPENCGLVHALLDRRVTSVAFELIERDGLAVGLKPMSEIAGTLSAYYGAFLSRHARLKAGGLAAPGDLLARLEELAACYPDAPPGLVAGRAVIFGGGTVGRRAAGMWLAMGGTVTIVEILESQRYACQKVFAIYGSRCRILQPSDEIREALRQADVWIGGVYLPGRRAPQVMTPEDLGGLSADHPKTIMDVAIDQGGNFPEARSTRYDDPIYLDSAGNVRFAVPNIPSLCGHGASQALERAILPYTLALSRNPQTAWGSDPGLRRAVCTVGGNLLNEAVAQAHRLTWQTIWK